MTSGTKIMLTLGVTVLFAIVFALIMLLSQRPAYYDLSKSYPAKSYPRSIYKDSDESTSSYPANPHSIYKDSDKSTSVIDKIVSRLESANIAFNTPDNMMLGESVTIELVLSPKESIEELQKMINMEGQVEGYEVKISNEMEARLSGTTF
jgi:hypothetical protein